VQGMIFFSLLVAMVAAVVVLVLAVNDVLLMMKQY
jgi:hypothetical protein